MNDSVEWIRADQLAEFFYTCGKDYNAGKAQLWNGLQTGRIRAKALDGKLWKGGRGYRAPSSPQALTDALIEPDIWAASVSSANLSLSVGSYTAASHGNLFSRVELTGLAFDRGQMVTYLGLSERVGEGRSPNIASGPVLGAPPSEKWKNFAAALVALNFHRPDFDLNDPRKTLYDAVSKYAADFGLEIPSLNTVGPSLDLMKEMVRCAHDDGGKPTDPPDLSEKAS